MAQQFAPVTNVQEESCEESFRTFDCFRNLRLLQKKAVLAFILLIVGAE